MTQAVVEHPPPFWREIPSALKLALLHPAMKWCISGAALVGLLLPLAMSLLIPLPPGLDLQKLGYPEWSWLSAEFLSLLSVSFAVSLAPTEGGRGWKYLCVALQLTLCICAACGGLKFSPWGAIRTDSALTLGALLVAQAWCWIGGCALAGWFFFFAPRVIRSVVMLKLALLLTALLWSRPFLLQLYKQNPAWAAPATQTLVEFCPITAAASAWNQYEPPLDLIKSPITYDLWIGSYQPVSYARLWPAPGVDNADGTMPLDASAGFAEQIALKFFRLFRSAVNGLGLIPFCALFGIVLIVFVDFSTARNSEPAK